MCSTNKCLYYQTLPGLLLIANSGFIHSVFLLKFANTGNAFVLNKK